MKQDQEMIFFLLFVLSESPLFSDQHGIPFANLRAFEVNALSNNV